MKISNHYGLPVLVSLWVISKKGRAVCLLLPDQLGVSQSDEDAGGPLLPLRSPDDGPRELSCDVSNGAFHGSFHHKHDISICHLRVSFHNCVESFNGSYERTTLLFFLFCSPHLIALCMMRPHMIDQIRGHPKGDATFCTCIGRT